MPADSGRAVSAPERLRERSVRRRPARAPHPTSWGPTGPTPDRGITCNTCRCSSSDRATFLRPARWPARPRWRTSLPPWPATWGSASTPRTGWLCLRPGDRETGLLPGWPWWSCGTGWAATSWPVIPTPGRCSAPPRPRGVVRPRHRGVVAIGHRGGARHHRHRGVPVGPRPRGELVPLPGDDGGCSGLLPDDLELLTLADQWDRSVGNRAQVAAVALREWHLGMVGHGARFPGETATWPS